MPNKHGPRRHILEETAIEIRRRSKFGCLIWTGAPSMLIANLKVWVG